MFFSDLALISFESFYYYYIFKICKIILLIIKKQISNIIKE